MALASSATTDSNNSNKCISDYVEEKHIFHVLAVDDSNIDRKLLERLLTVSSYQVTCVESGDKALEYLGLLERSSATISCDQSSKSSQQEVSKVNLIMTDYSMPGISGYDLLKRIKDSSWKDVPVIVMSSENVPSRINMCLEGGAEEFLLKPVKLSDLSKLQSHILKHTISHEIITTIIDDDEETKTNDVISRDENECDKNCSNANKRKATLARISSDLSRPRVHELSVS
ncbi:Two-component response regulator Orr4 [Castilleja foliolosa]|uniref:Two-component response regulator Orr4 n=1 Tax=Castilleja foliolosa TaxID=1961234 RepID=A0ABD3DI10_9LAMI